MEANELMIGDWVRIHSDICPERVSILKFGVDVNCEPIPLTAEILEKNGFKEKGVFYCLDTFDYYGLYICEITESIWRVQFYNHECSAFDSIICVGYVHELQHALRLCGIDKEIVL